MSDDKKVTINLNGKDLLMPIPTPVKSNFFKDYQILLGGLLIAVAIGVHTWLAYNMVDAPQETQKQAVTQPTPQKQAESPWKNRLVKELSPTK